MQICRSCYSLGIIIRILRICLSILKPYCFHSKIWSLMIRLLNMYSVWAQRERHSLQERAHVIFSDRSSMKTFHWTAGWNKPFYICASIFVLSVVIPSWVLMGKLMTMTMTFVIIDDLNIFYRYTEWMRTPCITMHNPYSWYTT